MHCLYNFFNTHFTDSINKSYRKASSRGAYGHWSLLKCFWRASTWFHNNIYYNGTIYIVDNVIVPSDLVEPSGYTSKTLKKDHVHMRLWTRFYGILFDEKEKRFYHSWQQAPLFWANRRRKTWQIAICATIFLGKSFVFPYRKSNQNMPSTIFIRRHKRSVRWSV